MVNSGIRTSRMDPQQGPIVSYRFHYSNPKTKMPKMVSRMVVRWYSFCKLLMFQLLYLFGGWYNPHLVNIAIECYIWKPWPVEIDDTNVNLFKMVMFLSNRWKTRGFSILWLCPVACTPPSTDDLHPAIVQSPTWFPTNSAYVQMLLNDIDNK